MATKKQKDIAKKVGIGAAVTGLVAAAAAGGYYLYGPHGEKNRVKVKSWMLKAKGEVLEKMEKLREIDQDAYNKIVDQVATRYAKMKTVTKKEADEMARDLKKHWKQIYDDVVPHLQPAMKSSGSTTATKRKSPAKKKTAKKK
jgi:hypothetical protein